MNSGYAAKKHWFQEAVLKTEMVAEQEKFRVLGCAVPPFYYRHKPWKCQVLSETMETVLGDADGMTDTYVHPQIREFLTEEYCAKWMPRESTTLMLVKYLLEQYAGNALDRCGSVALLLGAPADTDRQMKITWELLQPYLPKVNRMLIYYEKREEWQDIWNEGRDGKEEKSGENFRGRFGERLKEKFEGSSERSLEGNLKRELQENLGEELQEYLEAYYYEYGLVPQLEPYRAPRIAGRGREREENILTARTTQDREYGEERMTSEQGGSDSMDDSTEERAKLRCGKEKCRGVILDFCDQFRYPRILTEDSVYIDIVSSEEKERRVRQKSLTVPYVSPLKYLDTMVKNSYDRKVKMT